MQSTCYCGYCSRAPDFPLKRYQCFILCVFVFVFVFFMHLYLYLYLYQFPSYPIWPACSELALPNSPFEARPLYSVLFSNYPTPSSSPLFVCFNTFCVSSSPKSWRMRCALVEQMLILQLTSLAINATVAIMAIGYHGYRGNGLWFSG